MGITASKYEQVPAAVVNGATPEETAPVVAPIPNHLLPYHLQVRLYTRHPITTSLVSGTWLILSICNRNPAGWIEKRDSTLEHMLVYGGASGHPVARNPCKNYENTWHSAPNRIRMWNALFWVIGMALIVLLYLGGMMGGIYNIYIGNHFHWSETTAVD